MNDPWSERLSEHLDGGLSSGQQREMELHLESCRSCRDELDDLRRIKETLARLPALEPPERVWRRIRGALEESRAVWPARWAWSLSVAGLVVALAAGFALRITREPSGPDGSSTAIAALPDQDAGARAYAAAAQAWKETLIAEPSSADSAAMQQTLAANLGSYDRAIEECRAALERHPDDPELRRHLSRLLRSELRFLRRAEAAGRAALPPERQGT